MNSSISGVKVSNNLEDVPDEASSFREKEEPVEANQDLSTEGDQDSSSVNSSDEEQPQVEIKTYAHLTKSIPTRSGSMSIAPKSREGSSMLESSLSMHKERSNNNNGADKKSQLRPVGGLRQESPRPKVLAMNGSGFRSLSQATLKVDDSRVEEMPRFKTSAVNLRDWAPSAMPPSGAVWSGMDHLPEWDTMQPNDLTSRPTKLIQRDLDYSMQKLMNEKTFEQLIRDPLGRHRFREFLVKTSGTEHKLDMLFDLMQYCGQIEWLQKLSEGVYDMYLAHESDFHLELPEELEQQVFESLQRMVQLKLPLGPSQAHIQRSLFTTDFQLFVKSQLVEHNRLRLGSYTHEEDGSGLGDCFCLTNPRLRENPIVLVSPGFTAVTGYSSLSIIGRNCRFLQGPGTAPDSVQRIRDALNNGTAATELLLNYRRDGTPFFCLLTIIPLRDTTGQLAYFLGGQTNVTGQLTSSKGLSFLIGGPGTELNQNQAEPHVIHGTEVSTSLARYLKTEASDTGSVQTKVARSSSHQDVSSPGPASIRKGAAGVYDPMYNPGPGSDLLFGKMSDRNSLSSGSKIINKLFGTKSKQQKKANPFLDPKQRLVGAEGTMRKDHRSLQDQIEYFSSLYSKCIVFKRAKREITFVTQDLLAYLGFPSQHCKDIYANPLVHLDVITLLRGGDKEETKAIQVAVKESIKRGHQISVQVAIKASSKNKLLRKNASTLTGEDQPRYTTIHFTPLKDREDATFAYVAIVA